MLIQAGSGLHLPALLPLTAVPAQRPLPLNLNRLNLSQCRIFQYFMHMRAKSICELLFKNADFFCGSG